MNCFEGIATEIEPRGGSAIVEVNNSILIFGGVDRNQVHFNDLYCLTQDNLNWIKVETFGDIPTPRSGHAMVSYGKYVLLFGGIDFMEEQDYNDFYILETDSWVWKYIGESGVEIKPRNSHSFSILEVLNETTYQKQFYLVIYGGASSQLGPLGDLNYAMLPDYNEIDMNNFFLTWHESNLTINPDKREMHSTVNYKGNMYISGGRNYQGQLLSDVWVLKASYKENNSEFVWLRLSTLELPQTRCAHVSCIIEYKNKDCLFIFGGFTGEGSISSQFIANAINNDSIQEWEKISLNNIIAGRFGSSSTSISSSKIKNIILANNQLEMTYNNNKDGMIIFGGVDANIDYNKYIIIWNESN